MDRFLQLFGIRKKGDWLRVAKILQLDRRIVRKISGNKKWAFLQNMEVSSPINILHKALGRVCERSSTDYEVSHRLRENTGALNEVGIIMADGIWMTTLQTLQCCVTCTGADYSNEICTEIILWVFRLLYINRFILIVRYF